MSAKKVKVEFEIDAPPDGYEVRVQTGDSLVCADGCWTFTDGWMLFGATSECHHAMLTLHRKRTLDEWANRQPEFQSLANLRGPPLSVETVIVYDNNYNGRFDSCWILYSGQSKEKECIAVVLKEPPSEFEEKGKPMLKLVSGKWVNP